ncbi:MAG: 3-deoxy-7-phosphoheptulonate synthase [Planctomycetes bacterium]|nr:3-deoxy-7-phosphoheptulonate synthase [Planctomycetota bacterium]MBI3832925.1 3-deoxy-7-phosphoheptulonate synthase [Planctomycetota bacterium]
MLILMHPQATLRQTGEILTLAETLNLRPYLSRAQGRRVIALTIEDEPLTARLKGMSGVEEVRPLGSGIKLTSRQFRSSNSVVVVGGDHRTRRVSIGSQSMVVIAGPCAVEDRGSLLAAAHAVRDAGADMLRGGAFKPRTSPYQFQGLGVKGLELLAEARQATGLPFVTEVLSVDDLPAVAEYADMLQVGARNMQNFALLRAVGESGRPVLLKRGMMSTVDEMLMSAEYILATGNESVVLCERGIRTFENSTRNTLDIAAVPVVQRRSHLPIIVDPSHAAGQRDLVEPLALAAVAVGAHGLLIEAHPDPDSALTDAAQTVSTALIADMVRHIRTVHRSLSPLEADPHTDCNGFVAPNIGSRSLDFGCNGKDSDR